MAIKHPGQTESARQRNAHIRSCAEALRLLAVSGHFGDEEKDMAAFLVFNLRGIYKTIDESALAWDDRNYWKKAEGLREKWRWSRTAAKKLEKLIRSDSWHEVPTILIGLIPHFQKVSVKTVTRDADWWVGAHRALLREKSE